MRSLGTGFTSDLQASTVVSINVENLNFISEILLVLIDRERILKTSQKENSAYKNNVK